MNKIINFLILIFFLEFIFTVNAETVPRREETDILLLTGNSPPFVYKNENNEIKGNAVTLVKKYLEQADISYQLQLLVWPRVLSALKNKKNKNIFLFPLSRLPEREAKFKWIVPLHKMHLQLYGLKNKVTANLDNLARGNYKFACVRNTLVCSVLNTFGIKEENIIHISELDLNHMIRLLQHGRINFILLNDENYTVAVQRLKNSSHQLLAMKHYQIDIFDYLAASLNTDQSIIEKICLSIDNNPCH